MVFPRQKKIVAGVVFYAVSLVSNESGRIVLSRSSFFIISTHKRSGALVNPLRLLSVGSPGDAARLVCKL
jgi:hypothetical protein